MDEPALYIRDGDGFVGTNRTQGAWDPKNQNGGSVLALLGHVLEDVPTIAPMFLGRLTVDLVRPVPLGRRLDLDATVVREGKKIQLVDLTVVADTTLCVRATALRLRVEDVGERPGMPASTTDGDPALALPRPEECRPTRADIPDAPGYMKGFEMREARVRGSDAFGYWVRLAVPVVAGEPIRPTSRLTAIMDFTNSIGVRLDPRVVATINPDVSAQVLRPPTGEWTAVLGDTRYRYELGRGISVATLSDDDGVFAAVTTSQLLLPR